MPGSVRLVSVRLTEPCRQVRIRFGSVGKFRIWSEPSWVTPKRPLFNKMAVLSKKKAAIKPRMKSFFEKADMGGHPASHAAIAVFNEMAAFLKEKKAAMRPRMK